MRSQAATAATRIMPRRKSAVKSQLLNRAILAPRNAQTGRNPSRPVKHAAKRRALPKPKPTKRQQDTAADPSRVPHPPERPPLQRSTQQPQHPAPNNIIAGPLPTRRSKLEAQRLINTINAPSGRQRPFSLPQTAKPLEDTQASKRGTYRATRRIKPVQRLNPVVVPSQPLKSKPASLGVPQRDTPTRLPATHHFHLFGPLVSCGLRRKSLLKRFAHTRARQTRRKARRKRSLAHKTRNLWRSRAHTVGMAPTSIRSSQVPTNHGDDDWDNVECRGLCIRQVLV